MQCLGYITGPPQKELATMGGTMDIPAPIARSRYASTRERGLLPFGHPACGAFLILTSVAAQRAPTEADARYIAARIAAQIYPGLLRLVSLSLQNPRIAAYRL
jgi:hypothetical protein